VTSASNAKKKRKAVPACTGVGFEGACEKVGERGGGGPKRELCGSSDRCSMSSPSVLTGKEASLTKPGGESTSRRGRLEDYLPGPLQERRLKTREDQIKGSGSGKSVQKVLSSGRTVCLSFGGTRGRWGLVSFLSGPRYIRVKRKAKGGGIYCAEGSHKHGSHYKTGGDPHFARG